MASEPKILSAREEWARGKGAFLAAFVVMMIGVNAMPLYTAGIFIGYLNTNFGWSRTEISAGTTIIMGLIGAMSPAYGYVIDRWSTRGTLAFCGTAVALGFFALSQMRGQLWFYYLTVSLMGMLGAGCSTMTSSRILNSAFHRMRGTALGLGLTGSGVISMFAPYLVTRIIQHDDWRAGYIAMGLFVVIALPVVWFLLGPHEPHAEESPAAKLLPGTAFDEAIRKPITWMLVVAFFCASLGVGGLIVHFVPIVVATGVPLVQASKIAGLSGISIIASRIVAGSLMDRIFAPYVGVLTFGTGLIGCFALAFGGTAGAYVCAISIGLCAGTEMDLLAYLMARYYGMRIFGRLYGFGYAAATIGTATAPLFYGFIVDKTGSYNNALMISAGMYFLAGAIMAVLPRFPAEFKKKPRRRHDTGGSTTGAT